MVKVKKIHFSPNIDFQWFPLDDMLQTNFNLKNKTICQ